MCIPQLSLARFTPGGNLILVCMEMVVDQIEDYGKTTQQIYETIQVIIIKILKKLVLKIALV